MNGPASSCPSTHRAMVQAVVTVLLCVLCGCAPGASKLTVSVRDLASGSPVPDAHVQLRPLHLFNPEPPGGIVDLSPTPGESGTTNGRGVVQLSGVVDHPMEVIVTARGYMPLKRSVVVDPSEPDQPWHDQLVEDGTGDAIPQLQVQIQP